MKIRRFYGKDMRDALRQVKEELGQDAVIMSNRKVPDGIELVAAFDKEPQPVVKPTSPAPATVERNIESTENKLPSLSEIIGDDGPDSLKALLEQQAKHAAKQTPMPSAEEPETMNLDGLGYEEIPAYSEIRRNVSSPESMLSEDFSDLSTPASTNQSQPESLIGVKDELAALREVLQNQVSALMESKKQRQRPVHTFISKRLAGMGLSYALADQLADFLPPAVSERDAWRYVLQLMVNRIGLAGNHLLSQTGAVALVGPTGTGKTTTIAKLAARYAKKHGPDAVGLITIDTFRIGAFEQLQTYAKIIGCVVKKAESAAALSDTLFQLRHKKMLFIDTAGFSHRDSRLLSQLTQLNQPGISVKQYLVLQANTQYPALNRAIQTFQNHQNSGELEGCILTKLDECYSLGEALSSVIENELPLSFVTDGQQVPEDIKPADAKSLVSLAAKLYKNYGLSHTSKQIASAKTRAV